MNIQPPDDPYPYVDEANPFVDEQKQGLINNPIYVDRPPTNTKKRIVFILTFIICVIFLIFVVLKYKNNDLQP